MRVILAADRRPSCRKLPWVSSAHIQPPCATNIAHIYIFHKHFVWQNLTNHMHVTRLTQNNTCYIDVHIIMVIISMGNYMSMYMYNVMTICTWFICDFLWWCCLLLVILDSSDCISFWSSLCVLFHDLCWDSHWGHIEYLEEMIWSMFEAEVQDWISCTCLWSKHAGSRACE